MPPGYDANASVSWMVQASKSAKFAAVLCATQNDSWSVYVGQTMQGKTNAKSHAEYIAGVGEKRRPDIQRLHDVIRECAEVGQGM